MLFPNLLLPGIPSFTTRKIRDRNELSGTEKFRTIQMPNESMKRVHEILIAYLRTLKGEISPNDGTWPGSSPRKNIALHRKNRYFYLIDIHDAYPSINGKKLAEIISALDPEVNKEKLYNLLKETCLTVQDGLITGAPASPDLFNIYTSILLDKPLKELCQKYKLIYTRYRDDLLFSAQSSIGKRKRKAIRKIVQAQGFLINSQKSKVYDLKKGPVVINGVGLEFGGRIFIPRHFIRRAKGLFHRATTRGDIEQEKIEGIMGAFWNVTGKDKILNKTEQKLVKKYQALKAR
ncbi:MAG: reverse transcriptase domain-containing protein [Patescibacteria group bacterium]